tara:strand:+ start:85 stop:429 length:345 start_codon:yes stop_codon:yes gene_type:complete
MLTRKHFIDFADFMVSLFNRNTQLICDITNDIDELICPTQTTCKNLGIDKIIEKRLLDYYNNNGKEIQLLLDKNSLRFNKYQFKNYIKSHVEKKQLNNIENENTTKLNKVGNMT